MIIKVPQFPWYGDTELELELHDSWEVNVLRMTGENLPKLTDVLPSLLRAKKKCVSSLMTSPDRPKRLKLYPMCWRN